MDFKLKIKGIYVKGSIVKSKRKGVLLEILPDGLLSVRASKRFSKAYIMDIIIDNEQWIYDKIVSINSINSIFINRKYRQDELYLLLGKYYKLKINSRNTIDSNINHSENSIILNLNLELYDIKEELIKLYKSFALAYIKSRVEFYLKRFNDVPKEVKVKNQKRIWGSCTGDNKLLFNWKIIMAPVEVIDYIVIHEMCHMKHKNHSIDFWNAVENILIDYKKSRRWLKENGITLEL